MKQRTCHEMGVRLATVAAIRKMTAGKVAAICSCFSFIKLFFYANYILTHLDMKK